MKQFATARAYLMLDLFSGDCLIHNNRQISKRSREAWDRDVSVAVRNALNDVLQVQLRDPDRIRAQLVTCRSRGVKLAEHA